MVSTNPFTQMFARSPFKPMQEHIAKAQQCAEQLIPFFEASFADDWESAEKIQLNIASLEHQADDIKKDIRQSLPSGLFLPVPRTDLLNLLRMQDKIANTAKDISGIMLGRKMTIPSLIQVEMLEFVKTAVQTSQQALTALNELDELIAAGFRGREVQIVEALIDKLDDLEHKTDDLERHIRYSLFKVEKELDPIDAMFLYKVISWTGDLADRAQDVGGRLQLLLAR
ncbi:MAG: TIGR00153 family protein [Oceanospirillaceae bacterium]|nr:TIGR00153 family protein [Oceanospirillaceae bacterium]